MFATDLESTLSRLDVCSNHQSSNDSDESSETDIFFPIINAIDLDALASVALEVRLKRERREASITKQQTQNLTCSVQTPPWTGSFNVVYAITFSDRVKWVARIPGNGVSSFGPLEAQKMVTDIQTTSLIRSITSVPVPEVYAWETTTSAIGAPYVLEGFVEGTLLSERWDDKSWSTEDRRLHILRNLAKIMSELHVLKFGKIGALSFNTEGQFSQIDGMVSLERDIEKIMLGEYVWGIASITGPFKTTKAWLLQNLDSSIVGIAMWRKAEFELLRLAIGSIPESFDSNGHFALGHPDFNYQNIFVDDEGNVTGIIDWDGVHALPRALGFARYPSWITRDWDPIRYVYDLPDSRDETSGEEGSQEKDLQEENSPEDDFPPEDPPEALLSYRRTYAAAFADLKLPASGYSPNDTRLSQILEAIEIGVGDRICRPGIIKRLLEHAFDGKVPFTFPQFCDAFEAEKAGPWMEEVREAFGKMWHEE